MERRKKGSSTSLIIVISTASQKQGWGGQILGTYEVAEHTNTHKMGEDGREDTKEGAEVEVEIADQEGEDIWLVTEDVGQGEGV